MPNGPPQPDELAPVVAGGVLVWLVAVSAIAAYCVRTLRVGGHPIAGETHEASERPRPWGLLVLFGVMVILLGDTAIGLVTLALTGGPDAADTFAGRATMLAVMLIGKGLEIAAVAGLAAWQLHTTQGHDVSFRVAPRSRDLGVAAATVLICQPPLLLLQGILQHLINGEDPVEHPFIVLLRDAYKNTQLGQFGALYGMIAVSVVVAAPVLEELVFRGLLQGWLRAPSPFARRGRRSASPRSRSRCARHAWSGADSVVPPLDDLGLSLRIDRPLGRLDLDARVVQRRHRRAAARPDPGGLLRMG
ncbi:MAG: hypothetical protein QM811_29030 [Pirellulales bacterium]